MSIESSGDSLQNLENSIQIDGMLSREEKDAFREHFQIECGDIHAETSSIIQDFLKTDLLQNIDQFDVLQQSTIKRIVEKNAEKESTQISPELQDFFHISSEGNEKVSQSLNEISRSGLDINNLLAGLRDTIETDLGFLSPEMKEKITQSIGIKTVLLSDTISDMNLGEMSKEEILSQRWIINSKIQEVYDFYTQSLFPSIQLQKRLSNGFVLPEKYTREYNGRAANPDYIDISAYLQELNEALAADLDEEGNFDEGFFSTQRLLHSSYHSDMFADAGVQVQEASLLNEKDKETEAQAMLYFLCAVGFQCLPYVGAVPGVAVDATDIFSGENATMEYLKEVGLVSEEYHMEKTWIDRMLAGAGIALSVAGLQSLARSGKLAKAFKGIKNLTPDIISESLGLFTSKMGLGEEANSVLRGLMGVEELEETSDVIHNAYRVENGERVSTGVASDEVLEANGLLSESERYSAAEELLGVSLTPRQQELLMQAHNVAQGNNVQKGMILMREGGFTRNQAQILMDQGIAGIFDFLKSSKIEYGKIIDSLDASKLQLGDKLQVQTNSGSGYEFQVIEIQNGTPILKWTRGKETLKGLEGFFGGNSNNLDLKVGEKLKIGQGETSPVKTIKVIPGKVDKIEVVKNFQVGEEVYVKRLNGTVERGWKVIQKNEDGTYKVQKGQMGKNSVPEEKLFSIQQIEGGNTKIGENAAEFERRKLQLLEGNMNLSQPHFNKLFNGDFGQQNTGNCYLVAALHSLKESPDFELIMRSSIRILGDGTVEVTIPLLSQRKGKKIIISQSDTLPQDIGGKIYQPIDGPIGFQILEAAYIKGKFGSLDRAKSEGGFGHEALGRMVGNNFDKTVIGTFGSGKSLGEQGKQDIFNSFAENYDPKRFIATANSIYNKGGHDSSYTIDGITIYHSHAYSILNIDKFGKTITLRNPWTRNEPFVMTYDQFLRAFSGVDGVQINYNNLLSNT